MDKRRITQETFDAVVRENIEDFEMDDEAALTEAIEQFKSQGVDLNYIVKAVPKASDDKPDDRMHEVLQVLEKLRIAALTPSQQADITDDLKRFAEQCSLEFAQRHLAAQKDAYPTILSCCQKSLDNEVAALSSAISALSSLTDGQPDLLDEEGRNFLIKVLQVHGKDPTVTCLALRAVRHFCLKHEQNRQDFVKAGMLALLSGAIQHHTGHPEVAREACAALRYMTFDDDIRVPFGHAHEHAKMIVLEHSGLKVLLGAAKAHPQNISVLSEVCATLSKLAVRNEFCQDIVDLGGLTFMISMLAECLDRQALVRQVLSAIKAIAGNDDVKDGVVDAGGIELMVMAMNRHMSNAKVCEQGCAAMCVLALRKPNNCKVIMENGGALVALQAMKAHPAELMVQKQSCMLLRNLASRTDDYNQPILEMGAEALILQALASHKDLTDEGKAALRDLGCKVELRERWTGQKGEISY